MTDGPKKYPRQIYDKNGGGGARNASFLPKMTGALEAKTH